MLHITSKLVLSAESTTTLQGVDIADALFCSRKG
jgi:hypothetical protein